MTPTTGSWHNIPERGSLLGMRVFARFARVFGRPLVRPLVALIASYFWLTSPRSRRASRDLMLRLGRMPNALTSWQHIHCFATVLLDRVLSLSGDHRWVQLLIDDEALLTNALHQQRGCLLLLAHFGSFDLLRLFGRDRGLRTSLVIDRTQGLRMQTLLAKSDPAWVPDVIDASQSGPGLVLAIKAALERGHIVGIMADRIHGNERVEVVDFLGAPCALPSSAYWMAESLRTQPLMACCVYLGGTRYRIRFAELNTAAFSSLQIDQVPLNRRRQRAQKIHQQTQAFAHQLQIWVKEDPFNWFNFYDFFLLTEPRQTD